MNYECRTGQVLRWFESDGAEVELSSFSSPYIIAKTMKVNPKNTITAATVCNYTLLCDTGDREAQPIFNVLTFNHQTILTNRL
jgi:hypothetical protein